MAMITDMVTSDTTLNSITDANEQPDCVHMYDDAHLDVTSCSNSAATGGSRTTLGIYIYIRI